MNIPIGLQLYSAWAAFQENPLATLRAVKKWATKGCNFFGAPQYCAEFYVGLLEGDWLDLLRVALEQCA